MRGATPRLTPRVPSSIPCPRRHGKRQGGRQGRPTSPQTAAPRARHRPMSPWRRSRSCCSARRPAWEQAPGTRMATPRAPRMMMSSRRSTTTRTTSSPMTSSTPPSFPGGPDIPLVADFDCATDRLILDFDGTEEEAPRITVDLETSPGNAVVEANGVAVTVGRGRKRPHGGSRSTSSCPEPRPRRCPHPLPAARARRAWARTAAGKPATSSAPSRISTANADRIEILYDPEVVPDPSVDVVDFSDGTGASIVLNGEPILHVVGAQGLDPSEVALRASPALATASPGACLSVRRPENGAGTRRSPRRGPRPWRNGPPPGSWRR